MKQQPTREKNVVVNIVKALKAIPGVVVRKRHGTAMGVAGDPDLYGSIKGKHFEIEVKRPDDRSSQLTKLQAERLREWEGSGAIAGVARTVNDVFQILGLKQDPRVRWRCCGCNAYVWEGPNCPPACPLCGHGQFKREDLAA